VLITRRAALKGALATTIGGLTGAVSYGMVYERHRLGVTEATMPFFGLPLALDGLRVALLTDVHHSALVSAEDVTRAVELTLSTRPDMIVLGGDYVTHGDRTFVEPVAELLAPLRAPNGVFAILGNHDDDREMPAALARKGITVLKDQRTRIVIRGDALEIAGIRFWTRRPADIAKVLRGGRAQCSRRALRPHAWRPGRAAGHRRGGAGAVPCRRGTGPSRTLVDLRQSGNRNGLRTGADQLPAGSGAHHTSAAVLDLTTRRPSIRHPPSSTTAMASG
jgi:hypothetical protein